MMIALADENGDGKIEWEEFIPVGIEAIKTFYSRNKVLQRMKANEKEINRDVVKHIYA
jgi:hypothetical protein